MPCMVMEGTLRMVTPRPPNRLAEPGRICSVVTPPFASARYALVSDSSVTSALLFTEPRGGGNGTLANLLPADQVVRSALAGPPAALGSIFRWAMSPREVAPELLDRLHDRVEAILASTDPEVGAQAHRFLCSTTSQRSVRGIHLLLAALPEAKDPALAQVKAAQRRAAASLGEERSSMAPADLARDAASSLREANLKLRDDLPREHSEWQRLRGRHDVLKQRLESLRSALP